MLQSTRLQAGRDLSSQHAQSRAPGLVETGAPALHPNRVPRAAFGSRTPGPGPGFTAASLSEPEQDSRALFSLQKRGITAQGGCLRGTGWLGGAAAPQGSCLGEGVPAQCRVSALPCPLASLGLHSSR